MAERVKCLRCDLMILEVTARINNGLCGGCKNDKSRADFEAIIQGWLKNPETLPGAHGNPEPKDIALSVAAKQIKARLNPDDQDKMRTVCEDFFDDAHDKWSRRGSSALSEKEKYALAVETFYGEITNGGLQQYFYNESGAFAEWAIPAFEAIGIPVYAEVMRNAKTLFPHGIIPEDRDERLDQLKEIGDERLEAVEQPFWERYSHDKQEIRKKLFAYLSK